MKYIKVSKEKHRFSAIKTDDFSYARDATVATVFLFELSNVLSTMPIVFKRINGILRLVALTGGIRNSIDKKGSMGKNIFISSDGKWTYGYTPAVMRVHPFRLGTLPDGKKILIIVDDESLLVPPDMGTRFFDEDGKETNLLKDRINLLAAIENSESKTDKACSQIEEMELIEGWPLEEGDRTNSQAGGGLYRINEQRFSDLDDKKFMELRHSGALQIIFAHFHSSFHLVRMAQIEKSFEKKTENLQALGAEIFANDADKTISFS